MASIAKFDEWQNSAGVKRGTVLQVVTNQTTSSVAISSIDTPTDTGLSATITPSSATSKILILVAQNIGMTGTTSDCQMNIQLLRGATRIWGTVGIYDDLRVYPASAWAQRTPITYLDSPNTTSPVTYKTQYSVRIGASFTGYTQYSGNYSNIVLMEIQA